MLGSRELSTQFPTQLPTLHECSHAIFDGPGATGVSLSWRGREFYPILSLGTVPTAVWCARCYIIHVESQTLCSLLLHCLMVSINITVNNAST